MKKLYWRPQKISLRVLWLVALVAVAGLVLTETYQYREKQPFYSAKIRAAKLARQAFKTIKQERVRLRYTIDHESDPAESGLIGELMSSVTTNTGYLPAKQTSINPNFAAVVVHLLKRAGVEKGDKVAVGMSGSFPAINICALAAMTILKVDPIIISSTGASQWGANLPKLTWPDMERILHDKGVFPFRSAALSRGGIDDRALGLPKKKRERLDKIIERNKVLQLSVANFKESVEKRMSLYNELAEDSEIKSYINVGGGTSSVGTKVGKKMFRPGLNRSVPRDALKIDSVMTRFGIEGKPLIHLVRINTLAERYGLPLQPKQIPLVGEGKIFFKEVRSNTLTAFVLIVIIVLLFVFVRLDWGYRLLNSSKRDRQSSHPEQMV
jgi:poly-gamma-glutamate system protein